eukprot:TRINITY_DN100728_c0_g1_i1.p1 TRINITY_DN100728_c0_g1~~TRINITY_DN100728_c0_g1_i1.p1  ORF type:complete len:310 (+),score=81.04 TRINITY_DN100728_c0_g1_i1:223-1152(+)
MRRSPWRSLSELAALLTCGVDGVTLQSRGPWPAGQKTTETAWTEVGKHCYAGKGAEDALLSNGAVEASGVADLDACKALCTGACESVTFSLTAPGVCRGARNVVEANCEASTAFATHKGVKALTPAAKAMVEAISKEQALLSTRLVEDESDVKATAQRLRHAIATAEQVDDVFTKMQAAVGSVSSLAKSNNQTMVNLKASRNVLRASVVAALETVQTLNNSAISTVKTDLKAVDKLKSVDKRATENLRVLKMLEPRLKKMEDKVDVVEREQRWGNLSQVIGEAVTNDITTVVEDISRGLAMQIPEKAGA